MGWLHISIDNISLYSVLIFKTSCIWREKSDGKCLLNDLCEYRYAERPWPWQELSFINVFIYIKKTFKEDTCPVLEWSSLWKHCERTYGEHFLWCSLTYQSWAYSFKHNLMLQVLLQDVTIDTASRSRHSTYTFPQDKSSWLSNVFDIALSLFYTIVPLRLKLTNQQHLSQMVWA